MKSIIPTTQSYKDNLYPPMRVRWICNKARVTPHHASAIVSILFGEAR